MKTNELIKASKYLNDNSKNQDYFPKDLPIIVEEVNMSSYQYNIYNIFYIIYILYIECIIIHMTKTNI